MGRFVNVVHRKPRPLGSTAEEVPRTGSSPDIRPDGIEPEQGAEPGREVDDARRGRGSTIPHRGGACADGRRPVGPRPDRPRRPPGTEGDSMTRHPAAGPARPPAADGGSWAWIEPVLVPNRVLVDPDEWQ